MAYQKRARRASTRPSTDSQSRGAATQSASRPAKRTKTEATAVPKATASAPAALPVPTNHPPTTVLDVFVFGNGEAGELGLGPNVTEAFSPQLNPFLSAASPTAFHVVQLACGGMHTVALTQDNQIVTWGVNDNGALGRDTAWEGNMKEADASDDSDDMLNPRESTPTAIPASAFPPDTTFVQVVAGDSFSFALTNAGLVYGWGSFRTSDGRELFLQDPVTHDFVARQSTPARIPGLAGITQIAAGANHVLALEGNGRSRRPRLWAWGCNEQSQLGRRLLARHCPRNSEGRLLMASVVPQPVAVADVCRIASGEYHAFAIDASERVWAWGLNTFGQTGADRQELKGRYLGTGGIIAPFKLRALAGQHVVGLAAGGYHSAALTADGRCLVWGKLDSGQVGVEMNADAVADEHRVEVDIHGRPRVCLRPVEVKLGAEDERIVAAGCGTDHTIFITDASTAYATGFNGQGQLGLGPDGDEEVLTAQRIDGEALQGRVLTWAGGGGQFSMVAGPHKDETESKSKNKKLKL